MSPKAWWRDIAKGYRTGLGTSLAGLTLAALATWAIWGRLSVWLEKKESSIRLSLYFVILGLLGLDGWLKFRQANKAKRELEAKLADFDEKNQMFERQLADAGQKNAELEQKLAEAVKR